MPAMRLSSWHAHRWLRRGLHAFALVTFVLGAAHCSLMGLAGRDCGSPSRIAAAPAEHACCAARHHTTPKTPAPPSDASCCLRPAPLPAGAQLGAPDDLGLAALVLPAVPTLAARVSARPATPAPEDGSPPGAPTLERSLGRAPPLA